MSSVSSTDESDSFSSLQADFERLTETLSMFASEIDSLGENLVKIQTPIEHLEIDQLILPTFLEKSPFRLQGFLMKPPGFPGIDLRRRYPFHEICTLLRNYVFAMNLVKENGSIEINAVLGNVFAIEDRTVEYTYLDLLTRLKYVLV